MRPLAVLGDNITTDHLSPSNAILADSASGEYLAKMGLPEEDFNSYATHRGDHLTAQRATFANPTLKNEMVLEDGHVKAGSLSQNHNKTRIKTKVKAGAISGKVTVNSVAKAKAPETSEASSRLGSMLRSADEVNM